MIKERDPSTIKIREISQVSQLSEKKSPKEAGTDWNLKFVHSSSEAIIAQFHQAAVSAFKAIWEEDCSALSRQAQRYY